MFPLNSKEKNPLVKYFWDCLLGRDETIEISLNNFPKFRKALISKNIDYKFTLDYDSLVKAFPFLKIYIGTTGFIIRREILIFPSFNSVFIEFNSSERFRNFLRALKDNGLDSFE